jgi:hypothetical protein
VENERKQQADNRHTRGFGPGRALPAGPARAAAYLPLGEGGADPAEEKEYLAWAIADSAAAPGLRAQALARLALAQVTGDAQRIAEAEQLAGQALAAASSADLGAERRALVALAWARVLRGPKNAPPPGSHLSGPGPGSSSSGAGVGAGG